MIIQLGKADSPTTAAELKAALEASDEIDFVKLVGDEQKHKDLVRAIAILKEEQSDKLQSLNEAQFRCNQLDFAINGQRQMLYSDWSKYMHCLYPVDRLNDNAYPDSDLVKHFIESKTIPALKFLQSSKPRTESSIEQQRSVMDGAFKQLLDQYDIGCTISDDGIVKKIPAPRFWEPNEPALLISGQVARPSCRHGKDGTLSCEIADIDQLMPECLIPGINSLPDEWKGKATKIWDRQPWNPIMMEWEVALYPDHQSKIDTEDQLQPYNPDFIKESYRIPLNDAEYALPSAAVDLKPRPGAFKTSPQPSIIKGRSLLTGGVSALVKKQLDEYLEEKVKQWQSSLAYKKGDYVLKAGQYYKAGQDIDAGTGWTADHWQRLGQQNGDPPNQEQKKQSESSDPVYTVSQALNNLGSTPCLSQQLDGLYDEYLMQSSGLRLPIDDPHRFVTMMEESGHKLDQSLTGKVKTLLGNQHHKLPVTASRFIPIRSGIVRLNQVRIVDTFGRYKDIACDDLLRPQRQLLGGSLYLPPRLVQPARLNLRWRMLPQAQLESLGYQSRTPVCGWLLYNYFDETLVIYDTAGHYLGAINSDGEWQSENGINYPDTDNIDDSTLRKFVDKLRSFHHDHRSSSSSGKNYLPQLKRAIRRGQESIEPEIDNADQSLLRSQPMAVVCATLDLQLKGLPQTNKSWRALKHDMMSSGSQRACRRFTAVKFPVKIGEYRNLDDGLICYWTQNAKGELSRTGYFPQSDTQDIENLMDAVNFKPLEHDYIDAIKDKGVANLHHSLEDPPLDLVMLIDPEAPVHATTGILPKKFLRLEAAMYQNALKNIEISCFAAPLLTPRTPGHQYALPLPAGAWQWEQPYRHATPAVDFSADAKRIQLNLGVARTATIVGQLQTALKANIEMVSSVKALDALDDELLPHTYNALSRELVIAGKRLTIVPDDGWNSIVDDDHPVQVDYTLAAGITPVVAITDGKFIIDLAEQSAPASTVSQLKEALEQKAGIESVETQHSADERLIYDHIDQSNTLHVAGKRFEIKLQEGALADHSLQVQYELTGALQLPSIAVVDKPLFLSNGGTTIDWDTLNTLKILRSDPQQSDRAYYFPPSQDPADSEIADWAFVREALENSKRPSLTAPDRIAFLENSIEAVEGYFKKINLPGETV